MRQKQDPHAVCLLTIQDINGIAELVPLILFYPTAADEGSEVGIGIGGGIEFSG